MNSNSIIKKMAVLATVASANFAFSQACYKELSRGGLGHIFGITENNSLYGWGKNTFYELGNGTDVNSLSPIQIGNGKKWKKVDASSATQAGILSDGTLWTWSSKLGAFGTDETITQLGIDNDWAEVSVGNWFAIMLKTDGSLWAVGSNTSGVLGTEQDSDFETTEPIVVDKDNTWKAISAGSKTIVAVRGDGTLWTWGDPLSDYDYNRDTPVQLGRDSDWMAVSCGDSHALMLKENGELYAFGYNNRGQIGDGTKTDRPRLVKVGNAKWKKISAGKNDSSFGIQEDGTLWAWGKNDYNNLGLNSSSNFVSTPTKVSETTDWTDVYATAGDFTFALKNDKTIWASGKNSFGNFGNDTQDPYTVFTKVQDCPYDVALSTTESIAKVSTKIYPNPAKDIVNVSIVGKLISVEIFATSGQKVLSSKEAQINVSHLAKGVYIVKTTTDKGSSVEKLIKN